MNIEQIKSFSIILSARDKCAKEFINKATEGLDPQNILHLRAGFRSSFEEGWDKALEWVLENHVSPPK